MALESTTYINGLVATNPAGTDARSQGDDHIRMVKSSIKLTFPNITGAVTPTHTELNYVDGVTSAIQTQVDLKAPLASPTFTGTAAAPTAATSTNTTQLATTAFTQAAIDADVTTHAAFRSSQTVYGHAKIYTSGGDLYIVTT
jgi:hypothetical protein